MSGWGHFLNTRAGAITLLIALIVGSACGGGQQPNVTTTESSVTDGGTSSDTSSDTKEGQASSASDSLFFDVPDGRLHAEAWPESEGDRAWRALEIGEGIFVSSEAHGAPWRFVFSSRESSLPVRGLWIEFPPGMDPALRPTAVQLRMSPTPIEITREAWPVVSPLLRSYGVAELPRGGGDGVFIEFDAIERVSLLEIRVLSSVGGRQVGSVEYDSCTKEPVKTTPTCALCGYSRSSPAATLPKTRAYSALRARPPCRFPRRSERTPHVQTH